MGHIGGAADRRSASEIMAEARILQTRHVSRAFAAAGRWLREAVARRAGED